VKYAGIYSGDAYFWHFSIQRTTALISILNFRMIQSGSFVLYGSPSSSTNVILQYYKNNRPKLRENKMLCEHSVGMKKTLTE